MARLVIRTLALTAALAAPLAGAQSVLPDPTRPPSAADGSPATAAPDTPGSLAVTTIVFGPSRRIALLNGRLVHEGSTVGAARVVRIERDAVFVEIAGQSRRLPVYSDPAHQPAKINAVLPTMAVKERNHD